MTLQRPSALNNKGPADFESAVAATKFGPFNILLLLVSVPAMWVVQFEATMAAYIIPIAACDLALTPAQKGLLNSMPFIGMLSSTYAFGFLLDTIGRKKVLFGAFCLQTVAVLGKALSTGIVPLSVFMFFSGFLAGGIYVAVATFVLEFHATEYRSRIQVALGAFVASGNLLVPIVAVYILPANSHFYLGFIEFRAWNLLNLVNVANATLCAIAFYFLPETPKFLMAIGRDSEALQLFRRIFARNTGQLPHHYPIDSLVKEIDHEEESAAKHELSSWSGYFRTAGRQLRLLFGEEYGGKLVIVATAQSLFMMGNNTLRLYLPQLFQSSYDLQVTNNVTSTTLCDVIRFLEVPAVTESATGEDCVVNQENSAPVYVNSIIIAAAVCCGYFVAGILISTFKKKNLLIFFGCCTSLTAIGINWAASTFTIVILSSLYLTMVNVCFDIVFSGLIGIFPTTLRAMAVSISMLCCRLLTVVGNNAMPVLIQMGCAAPFSFLAAIVLMAVLVALFIPLGDKQHMK